MCSSNALRCAYCACISLLLLVFGDGGQRWRCQQNAAPKRDTQSVFSDQEQQQSAFRKQNISPDFVPIASKLIWFAVNRWRTSHALRSLGDTLWLEPRSGSLRQSDWPPQLNQFFSLVFLIDQRQFMCFVIGDLLCYVLKPSPYLPAKSHFRFENCWLISVLQFQISRKSTNSNANVIRLCVDRLSSFSSWANRLQAFAKAVDLQACRLRSFQTWISIILTFGQRKAFTL